MTDRIDEVAKLRTDMSYTPARPEFAPAMGGYNRAEVIKYIDEQTANAEAMRRVFYEKTQELRDELDLLSEENRRLRIAMDKIAPLSALPAPEGESGPEDNRKLVEQVAGILKARHEAELAARDERAKAAMRALEEARAEAARLLALVEGREAQIAGLNRELAERAERGADDGALREALAQKEAELHEAKALLCEKEIAHAALLAAMEADIAALHDALMEKDAKIKALYEARENADAEREEALNVLQTAHAALLAAMEADIAALHDALMEKDAKIKALYEARENADAEREEALNVLQSAHAVAMLEKDAELAELCEAHAVALAEKEAKLAELHEAHRTAIAEREALLAGTRRQRDEALVEAREAHARALTQKEAELAELRGTHAAELAQRDAEIDALGRARGPALAQMEAEIADARRVNALLLSGKDTQIEALTHDLNDMREKLGGYTLALAGSDSRAAELATALGAKREEVRSLAEIVEKKNAVIAAFNSELSDMRGDMCETRAAAERARERISVLEAELAARSSAPGPEAFARKESEIEALNDKLLRRENEMKRHEEEDERLNAVLAEREAELNKLREAIDDIMRIRERLEAPAADEKSEAAGREREACRIIVPNFSNTTR